MTSPVNDPYLAALEVRDKDIVSKEAALKREEAEHEQRGNDLRIRRQQFEAERQAHLAALASYTEFLKSAPPPRAAEKERDDDDEWSGSRLRMGEQRRSILSYIAQTSRKEAGPSPKLTVRAIAAATHVPNERVSNIIWKDTERDYLVRDRDSVRMTDLGYELLKRAGVFIDPA